MSTCAAVLHLYKTVTPYMQSYDLKIGQKCLWLSSVSYTREKVQNMCIFTSFFLERMRKQRIQTFILDCELHLCFSFILFYLQYPQNKLTVLLNISNGNLCMPHKLILCDADCRRNVWRAAKGATFLLDISEILAGGWFWWFGFQIVYL